MSIKIVIPFLIKSKIKITNFKKKKNNKNLNTLKIEKIGPKNIILIKKW